MFESEAPGPGESDASAIQALLRRCAGDSRLGVRENDAGIGIVVLDADGARVLHASPGGDALRRAISDPEGRVHPDLGIGGQIARSRPGMDHPLLVRLQLDGRRLAPPVLISLMRTALTESREAVVLVANAPLPPLRTRGAPARPDAAPEPEGTGEQAGREPEVPAADPVVEVPEPAVVRQRFTWESDAAGTVLRVSQSGGTILRRTIEGRTWRELAQTAVLRDAGGLLSAMESGRTFRAIAITLIDAQGNQYDLDLSGAPSGRTGTGFRGFGQIRAITEAPPSPRSQAVAPPPLADGPEAGQAAAPAPASPPVDPHLSSNEHAAFREIARALGARFAGDERPERADEPSLPCAVMPFPVPNARLPNEPSPDAAMVATLERIPSGVLVYRDDAVLFANRTLLDLVGYADRDDLVAAGGVGHLFGGLDPRARPAGETPVILSTRDGGRVGVVVEHSVLDWAGRPADLLLARDAEPGAEARAATATVIAQDFAARHGTDALAILDSLEDGIVLLDHQARILSLNRRTAESFGLDPREVVGASFLGLFAAEHAVDLLARLHAEPGSAVMEDAAVAARGTGRRLRVKVLPLAGDAGKRLCAVIRDGDPEPRDAAAQDRAGAPDPHGRPGDEVAQELLTRIGRSIQAPLKDMVGSIEGFLGGFSGPEEDRASLRAVHATGLRLLDLVNDVLDLASIEAGRIDLDIAEMPLNAVVSRCVALLQPEASRKRIVLRTSFSADLPNLLADERAVHRAAVNAIANAIARTEPGGQVIVSTTLADRGEVALRIRDTGVGMTADEVEGALHPFRHGPHPAPRHGIPLGLPLTKALVEANHGRFQISSKAEGTLVEMLFPVREATMRA